MPLTVTGVYDAKRNVIVLDEPLEGVADGAILRVTLTSIEKTPEVPAAPEKVAE
jgi:hypothetical protein